MQSAPRVTVAIPTLFAGPLLEKCLLALKEQTFRSFEVVVVNNGRESIATKAEPGFPLRVVATGSNVGFGPAINLVIRESSAPFIATLNDDTEPEPEWLATLVAEIEADPRVGMCASRIRLFEASRLDSAGMLICFDGSSKQRGHGDPGDAFPQSADVLFPSGCAALYRRAMLDEIGVFDEDYYLYCEDTDLGLRARWAGWKCRYAAGALVRHHYSQSAGAVSLLKARLVERNRLWVALKNFPGALLPLLPFMSVARYAWQVSAVRSRQGAASEFVRSGNSILTAARIILVAHWETLRLLPVLLRKRAQVRSTRRIGWIDFIRLMYRHRISTRELARS